METSPERNKRTSFLKKDSIRVKSRPGTLQKKRAEIKPQIAKPAVETVTALNTKPETIMEGYSFWV